MAGHAIDDRKGDRWRQGPPTEVARQAQLDIGDDDQNHLVAPEDLLRVAMTRQ